MDGIFSRVVRSVSLAIVVAALALVAIGQSDLDKWPEGSSPREVGKLLAEDWAGRTFEFETGKRPYLIYPEACAWYGALNIAEYSKNLDLQKRLQQKFARFMTPEGGKPIAPNAHVDYRVIGIIPLEIYL